jgi:prepilin-type N-terminal cleavage/methylation domain-containing protein
MKTQHGMTLIEVMVALVLLSLLSVGLFAAFRAGQRSYVQVVTRNGQARDMLIAQRFLRRIIETAYPFVPNAHQNTFALQGAADDITLTASAPGSDEVGLTRYHVFLTNRTDGLKDLVVQYWIDRNGLMPDAASIPTPEILVEKLRDVEFS